MNETTPINLFRFLGVLCRMTSRIIQIFDQAMVDHLQTWISLAHQRAQLLVDDPSAVPSFDLREIEPVLREMILAFDVFQEDSEQAALCLGLHEWWAFERARQWRELFIRVELSASKGVSPLKTYLHLFQAYLQPSSQAAPI